MKSGRKPINKPHDHKDWSEVKSSVEQFWITDLKSRLRWYYTNDHMHVQADQMSGNLISHSSGSPCNYGNLSILLGHIWARQEARKWWNIHIFIIPNKVVLHWHALSLFGTYPVSALDSHWSQRSLNVETTSNANVQRTAWAFAISLLMMLFLHAFAKWVSLILININHKQIHWYTIDVFSAQSVWEAERLW